MPINETVLIKASGSNLTRTIGFPLKEAFNVTDVSTLRLQNSSNANQAATFTVGARWNGLPSDTSKALKWVHVTFKDTGTPRDLHVVDTGGAVPSTTNPIVVTNNTNDITVANGLITAVFNKVADSANLLTSFLAGATEVLHASNKPRISVPTDKKTITTWTSGSLDFAAAPADATVKVGNASLFTVGETVNFEWEGTVGDYYPTGGDGGRPFIIMAAPFTLPEMTRALMDTVHQINIIINYGGVGQITVPVDYSQAQGFCLESVPATTPVAGMKIRIAEVEAITTKTIQSINAGANTITFTTPIGQYLPQGINVEPTTPGSSTALAQIVSGGTVVEKTYGDKAVIIKQTAVLKDGGANIEPNLTFEVRTWLYADVGFVRQRITLRNTVQAISTNACPPIFFKALNFDVPTAASASTVADSVTTESAGVARYKANNLHATLNHSGLATLQFCVHEHGVQFPNIATVNSTGFHFEIFPQSVGPIALEGGVIKSREVFWGLNAANGLVIPDTLGATFDPDYIAASRAVRPNMVGKKNWNTVFATEPQKFRDACNHYERLMACVYDISVCEATQITRPAQTLYQHRYALQEAGYGTYPFGWNKFGNTAEDVGFGNNRYDLIYCLLREGLRESDPAKSALAWTLAFQNGRNRVELGQMWNHQSQAAGTPDMYGLARYERAYAPNPFDYTNAPIANPTHSWNEGSCLLWALTDDPIVKEAAYAGVLQARQYNYQGTYGHRLYGTGSYTTKDPGTGEGNAEPRFAGWPIHTLVTGYRYFGEAVDLQLAQEYSNSFIVTMAGEPVDDGFTLFSAYGTLAPLFQHGGYCMHGIIETWRESTGATRTALGTYIGKVAKMLAFGSSALSAPGADSPLLTNGKVHPVDNTKYNPAVTFPFTYNRSFADTLAVGINTTDTTITLNNASTFNLGNNNKTGVLMGNINNPATWEYFTYTGVSGDTLTGVVRNFGASGAKSFASGTIVYPTGFGGAYNDIIVATLIMGARITGDPALQAAAQLVWEDNCLYRDQDPGNFITIGTYMPVNLWFRNISTNSLKLYAQGATALSEFIGDRLSAPSISSLSPSSVTAGASAFTLTVNGSNFATDAVVKWNGTNLTTTFVSSTQLTAAVTAPLVASAATANVTVTNVTDATDSNVSVFTINASGPAAPTVSGISPNTAIVGVATGALTITGTTLGSATVTVDGVPVTPTSNSATEIVLPTQTFTSTGTKTVAVTTAGGSANTSITVSNPAPVVSGISPTNTTAGAAQFTLNITGLGFVPGSVVRWNGTNLSTTFVSPTQLTAIISAGLLTTAGVATVTVFTATPGGGTSAGQVFTINAVGPTITNISPATGLANVATGPITINGTNLGNASVTVDGVSVTPTSNTSSQIILPTQTFASTGAKSVIVTTAGGSATTSISVNPPPPPPPPTTGGITLQGAVNVFIGAWRGQPALVNTNTPGGANSTQEIPVGYTGYVQVQPLTAKQDTHFGISSANNGSNPAAINFAIHFRDDFTVVIKQAGTVIFAAGVAANQVQSWELGDQFQIYVERDRILFMRNWKVFHTVARPPGVAYRFACTTNGLTAALGNPIMNIEGAQ